MSFQKVNKILLFRLCCIGDVAMLTPVITNLNRRFPDAEIVIAASKWINNLLPWLPVIKRAIIFDAPFENGFLKRLTGTIKFIFSLRKEKFDMVITAHRSRIYGLILKLAGIRYRLGFVQTSFINYPVKYDGDAHFTTRHLNILTGNGIEAHESSLSLVSNSDEMAVKNEYGLSSSSFIIGLFPFGGSNPGTEMNIKRWYYKNYVELVNRFNDNSKGINVILMEGYLPEEKISDEFQFNGAMKLKMTNELISVCDIFVSGDTGPLYIAEGLAVSTLSIFGPTDAGKTAPKSSKPGTIHRCIWKKPYCSPCYTTITAFDRNNPKYWSGNTFICNTGTHECIKSITVDDVYYNLEEMIIILQKNRNLKS